MSLGERPRPRRLFKNAPIAFSPFDPENLVYGSNVERAAMNLAEFQLSLNESSPPPNLPLALQALWFDAKAGWNEAHELAQQEGGFAGDWVHAYLHRKEGDDSNARYWYGRAGKPICSSSLEEEWAAISKALLALSSVRD